MKTIRIAAIVLISILTLFLIFVLWRGISYGDVRFGGSVETRNDCSLIQEKEFPAEDISALRIRYYDFMDVRFYKNDSDTVRVREYLNFTPGADRLTVIKADGSVLSVQGTKKRLSTPFPFRPSPWGYAEIYLPSGVYESLQVQTVSGDILSELSFTLSGRLSVTSTSGDISFPEAEALALSASSTSGDISFSKAAAADKITVSTTSGDITLSHAQGGEISVSTTSGEIRLDSLSGESLHLSSVSGDAALGQLSCDGNISTTSGGILIENAEYGLKADTVSGDILVKKLQGAFRFSTTSGDITVESGAGSGYASTTSGEIHLSLEQSLLGDLTLTSTGGDITLILPETDSFYLDFDSVSGDCSTFFDASLSFNKRGTKANGQYGNSGKNRLEVSTTSGSLRIDSTQD